MSADNVLDPFATLTRPLVPGRARRRPLRGRRGHADGPAEAVRPAPPVAPPRVSLLVLADELYLPPQGRYFGCRRCHDLTYTSCQESHKCDRPRRMLARDTGYDPVDV